MNYFAHGLRFIDRPGLLAGTAVPDWLGVSDRKTRMRPALVEPCVSSPDALQAEVAAGVLQHLADDCWFHKTRAFYEVSGELARRFRERLGGEDGVRPTFLGHVALEMTLDRVLIRRDPDRLAEYYAALESIDPQRIQAAVNRMARQPASRLAEFITLFLKERFLEEYLDPARLLFRLNQVQRRVRLKPLPDEAQAVLAAAERIVAERLDELLPLERFSVQISTSLAD
ncbi:MAG: hypothetical protein ACREJB_01095 [Planctomycetaceae bacterium]